MIKVYELLPNSVKQTDPGQTFVHFSFEPMLILFLKYNIFAAEAKNYSITTDAGGAVVQKFVHSIWAAPWHLLASIFRVEEDYLELK
jgi:hypothetical protein